MDGRIVIAVVVHHPRRYGTPHMGDASDIVLGQGRNQLRWIRPPNMQMRRREGTYKERNRNSLRSRLAYSLLLSSFLGGGTEMDVDGIHLIHISFITWKLSAVIGTVNSGGFISRVLTLTPRA